MKDLELSLSVFIRLVFKDLSTFIGKEDIHAPAMGEICNKLPARLEAGTVLTTAVIWGVNQ